MRLPWQPTSSVPFSGFRIRLGKRDARRRLVANRQKKKVKHSKQSTSLLFRLFGSEAMRLEYKQTIGWKEQSFNGASRRMHLTHFVLIFRFELKSPQRFRLKSHPHPTFMALHNRTLCKSFKSKKEKQRRFDGTFAPVDQERRVLIIAEIDSELAVTLINLIFSQTIEPFNIEDKFLFFIYSKVQWGHRRRLMVKCHSSEGSQVSYSSPFFVRSVIKTSCETATCDGIQWPGNHFLEQ
jgi:hypothetical protein